MELNNIFINEGIIDIIYQLLSFDTKIIFNQLNRHTYLKYNDSIKNTVFQCINSDYHIFKRCFQRYTYSESELLELGICAIQDIQTISDQRDPMVTFLTCNKYFDLRYLFELIYHGFDVYHNNIIKKKNLIYIIKKIQQCISFNRFETIQNINKEPSLYPLHILFKSESNDWKFI